MKTIACLLGLGLTAAAFANPANRIYFKHNGKVAAAIDPSGNWFSRSFDEDATTQFTGSLTFKRNGTVFCSIRNENASDPRQLGKMMILPTTVFFTNSGQIPFEPSGTFVFKSGGQGMMELDHVDASISIGGENSTSFGARQNAFNLTGIQKTNFVDAIRWADQTQFYPGTSGVQNPAGSGENGMGGVSHWDKVAQIHNTLFLQIHHEGRFLPWHRECLARMEDEMRTFDPLVSLPYWDWQENPVTTFPPIIRSDLNEDQGWLGRDFGRVGDPFEFLDNNGVSSGSYEGSCAAGTCNPALPPQTFDRFVESQIDPIDFGLSPDSDILPIATYQDMRIPLEFSSHDAAHDYLCDMGEVFSGRAPMDPMFWLLHTNADRIWAAWQNLDFANRTNPATAYGTDDDLPSSGLNGNVEPWSGGAGIRPWTAPDNQQVVKTYKHPSILIPRLYE